MKNTNTRPIVQGGAAGRYRLRHGPQGVEFEPTDSASDKALYVYRLLVHDKVIAPMPEEQVADKTVRHRLAAWYAHKLPKGHRLLD